jgi:hypothetical protein
LVKVFEEKVNKETSALVSRVINSTESMVKDAVDKGRLSGILEVFRAVRDAHQAVLLEREDNR